jgi:hypothetical protein
MFKAVYKGWNYARLGEAWYAAFWGLLCFIGWERTRLIGCSRSGSLVTIDCRDWCNALMLNPLSPRKHIRLPRLPKRS